MSGSRSCHHHHQPHQCSTACSPVHYTVVRHTLHSFERVIRVRPSQLGVTSELWDGQKWQCWWDACNGRDLCSLLSVTLPCKIQSFLLLSYGSLSLSLPSLTSSACLVTRTYHPEGHCLSDGLRGVSECRSVHLNAEERNYDVASHAVILVDKHSVQCVSYCIRTDSRWTD